MCFLHNKIEELCNSKGITRAKLCADLGISKSVVTNLKSGRAKSLTTSTALSIAKYFGITVDELLGVKESENNAQREDEIIRFALFGNKEISDATFEKVKQFAKFVAEEEERERKTNG